MRCPNCNKDINANTSFCPYCGTKAVQTIEPKKLSLKCQNCGGTLDIDENQTLMCCPFCGSKEIIVESDVVKVERIRSQTQTDIEKSRINAYRDIENAKFEFEKEKQQQISEEQKARKFKKGPLAVYIIVFCVLVILGLAGEANQQKYLCVIIALCQIVALIAAYLFGARIIKEPIPGLTIILTIIASLLIVPFFMCT